MEIKNHSKQCKTTKHLVYSCQYHVIFCPKYRRKVLIDDIEKRLKELILEKQEEYGYEVLDLEVMPDHVHLVLDADPMIGIITIVSKIKGYTSKQLREEFSLLKKRIPTLWTHSRFISTVGAVTLEDVNRYIEEQKHV
jgi:putative transposase